MFDQTDIRNLGEEYERGLRAFQGDFNDTQIKALRTAFEIAIMNALVMIQGRIGK
ncbi:MAG: hypothetical protein JW939_05805 [Candidatus Thermoplasmatota archaeon]|nr:hypothetical protein [Candidatus Thermoplasmatota archaeon]